MIAAPMDMGTADDRAAADHEDLEQAGPMALMPAVGARAGDAQLAAWIDAIVDQESTIRADVLRVRSHPLIDESVLVGGFLYDVDTGLLTQVP